MSSGINLVMTVIGFSVSTMFIVFVFTRLICARIHLAASSSYRRRSFAVSSGSDLSSLERGLHGVEPLVIANFPTKKYSDAFFSSAEDAQCTVCLGDYHGEDTLRILPFCAHFFHATCIDIWLKQHSTCPVCRLSLRELPEKKRMMMQPMFSSAIRFHHGTTDSADHQNPHNCSSTGQHRFQTRYYDNHRVGSVHHEDQQCSLDSEASESNVFPSIRKEYENKHMESPSNP